MNKKLIGAGVLLVSLISCLACTNRGSTAVANQQTTPAQNASGELRFKAPDGWTVEKPNSSMRVAQYKLPKAEADNDDTTLVLYYFGATQGGTSQANIDRWISQMKQPDGSASKDKAKTETTTINGLKVTTVDVSGTYTAEMAPGRGS